MIECYKDDKRTGETPGTVKTDTLDRRQILKLGELNAWKASDNTL